MAGHGRPSSISGSVSASRRTDHGRIRLEDFAPVKEYIESYYEPRSNPNTRATSAWGYLPRIVPLYFRNECAPSQVDPRLPAVSRLNLSAEAAWRASRRNGSVPAGRRYGSGRLLCSCSATPLNDLHALGRSFLERRRPASRGVEETTIEIRIQESFQDSEAQSDSRGTSAEKSAICHKYYERARLEFVFKICTVVAQRVRPHERSTAGTLHGR